MSCSKWLHSTKAVNVIILFALLDELDTSTGAGASAALVLLWQAAPSHAASLGGTTVNVLVT